MLYCIFVAKKYNMIEIEKYGDTRDRYSVTHLSIRQLNKEYNRYK